MAIWHQGAVRGGFYLQFYTYSYIAQLSQMSHAAWYTISFLVLAALFFFGVKYLRNRLVSRYRDLVVILFLAVAFLGGFQYCDYNRFKNDREQTSRMTLFLHSISEDFGVPVESVRTNSTYLKQGMLVDVQGVFYAVTFNADFTSFTYERTHLLSREVKIVDKEE